MYRFIMQQPRDRVQRFAQEHLPVMLKRDFEYIKHELVLHSTDLVKKTEAFLKTYDVRTTGQSRVLPTRNVRQRTAPPPDPHADDETVPIDVDYHEAVNARAETMFL